MTPRIDEILRMVETNPGITTEGLGVICGVTDLERLGRKLCRLSRQGYIRRATSKPVTWVADTQCAPHPKLGGSRMEKWMLTYGGVTKHSSEWARDLGLTDTALKDRIYNGWTVADAVTIPRGGKRRDRE